MRLLLIQLFLTCVFSASAQSTISGIVNGEGEPLTGAYVYPLQSPDKVVLTDSTGRFQLDQAVADTVIFSYLGYQPKRQYLEPGQTDLSIELLADQALSGPAATVRAQRIRPGELASVRISQLDIYLDPAAKADPLLAVNNLPSATNLDETANVSLRGSPSAATGIYLDGVPVRSAVRLDQSNGLGQFSIFGQFPLAEVRVYAAHPPIGLGRASAGAVQLRTSDQRLRGPSYGLSLSLAGLGLAHSRPLGTKSDLRTFINWSNLSAFRTLNEGTFSDLRRSAALDGAVALNHYFNERSQFKAYLLAFAENYNFRIRTTYLDDDLRQEKHRQLAILNWQHTGDNWRWTLSQSFDWDRSDFSFGNIRTQPDRFKLYSAISARREGSGFSHEFGLQLDRFQDRVNGTFPQIDYRIGAEDAAYSYNFSQVRTLLTGYLATEKRLNDWLTVEVGSRTAYQFDRQIGRVSAQGSIHFRPNRRHRLVLGGGHYQQLLSPGPEVDRWQWLALRQLALSYYWTANLWSAEFALYRKQENYEELSDQHISGLEGRLSFRDNGYTAWLSGSITRVRSTETDIPSSRDLPFLIRAQLIRASLSGWSFGLSGTYREGRYYLPFLESEPIVGQEGIFRPLFAEADAGSRLPNYLRLDLSISRIINLGEGQLIAFANLNNLFDRKNVRSYLYPNGTDPRESELYSRRILFLGVVWQFSPD